ncbi:hypothetical protein TRIUR3_00275 [Triticum urartu]|uniref:Wall-associated receptor kinase galacturonan-binding domain-containing protein n=1 Tax=Triticum urartu TaxID=4572 RepID=M8ALJ4_TRIUA|nr:hypothetical protein TRIUR3_00275 [Triticum urartu]
MPALLLAAACEPERCGNLSISAPFGVVSGSEENRCAQAQLGFQVHCTDGVPYLGYYEPEYGLKILDIFYNNGSLLVSDVHKIGGFNLSDKKGCRVPTANTATKVGPPFSLSPLNQNLVFYNCTKVPAGQAGLVETGCISAFLTVLGVYGEANASNYARLINRVDMAITFYHWLKHHEPQWVSLGLLGQVRSTYHKVIGAFSRPRTLQA